MSEQTNTARKQHPASCAADSARHALCEACLGFNECIIGIVESYGQQDALADLVVMLSRMGQHNGTEDLPPFTPDHFYLIQLLHALIGSIPQNPQPVCLCNAHTTEELVEA